MTEAEIKNHLEKVQRLVAELSANLAKAEALRDTLIRELCDLEGLHDRQPCPVR